jgi:uncharacterized membrane protein
VEPSNADPSSVDSGNSLENDQNIIYAAVITVALVAVVAVILLIQRRKSTANSKQSLWTQKAFKKG